MPLTVEIQYCKNCHLHSWCSRHDEIKYIDFFEQLSYRIESQFPAVQIKQRQIPEQLELIREAPSEEKKYLNKNTGQIAMFPRSGAFEVYVEGHRIFSKIKTKRWPKFDRIVDTLQKMITAHKNEEDLAVFDIEYEASSKKKLIPITNSDLYDIKTIFRVRKSVNESSRQSRTLEHHAILPDKDIAGYIASTNPQKNRYKNIRSLIPGWHGQTMNLDDKANVYLQEIYPRKSSRDHKKKRILLMKDDEHGSIILENQKGERETYFKNLQKKSRENSRNRRKLKPLTNTKPPIRNTRKFEDEIYMSEYSDAFEDHDKGLTEGEIRMRGAYGYRQSKMLKKRSDRANKEQGKSQSQSLLNNQEITEEPIKDDGDNFQGSNHEPVEQVKQDEAIIEQKSSIIDKNSNIQNAQGASEKHQNIEEENQNNQLQEIEESKQVQENQQQGEKEGEQYEQGQLSKQGEQEEKQGGQQNEQIQNLQQKQGEDNQGPIEAIQQNKNYDDQIEEDNNNGGENQASVIQNNGPNDDGKGERGNQVDVNDEKGEKDDKGDMGDSKGDKIDNKQNMGSAKEDNGDGKEDDDEKKVNNNNIGEQSNSNDQANRNQQPEITQKNTNKEPLIRQPQRNWGQFDCHWKAKCYGGQFHLIADDREEVQEQKENIGEQNDNRELGGNKDGGSQGDLMRVEEQSREKVGDEGQEEKGQKFEDNRNNDSQPQQPNKTVNQPSISHDQSKEPKEGQQQLQKQEQQPHKQHQQPQQHEQHEQHQQPQQHQQQEQQQPHKQPQKQHQKTPKQQLQSNTDKPQNHNIQDNAREQPNTDQIDTQWDHQWKGVYQNGDYELVGI